MDDDALGTVDLRGSSRLVFALSRWKGRLYANVRKFVSRPDYSGPTKSGLAMPGNVLLGLIDNLEGLLAEVPGAEQREFARVPKRRDVEVVVSIVPPDDLRSLPSVDVREHINTPDYTGPTKKGIRFPWDKLKEVIGLLKTQAQKMGAEESRQPTLFPDAKPEWVQQAKQTATDKATETPPAPHDAVLASLLPAGPKRFPDEFLSGDSGETAEVQLPSEPIEVVQQADGKHVVRSDFGFRHPVRNAIEGNFVVYAHLRSQRILRVPHAMIEIFKAVKAYENYLRDLRHALLQAYERKCGYRPVAEHQAKEAFKTLGLPWLES